MFCISASRPICACWSSTTQPSFFMSPPVAFCVAVAKASMVVMPCA
jgi:hypothetical protein